MSLEQLEEFSPTELGEILLEDVIVDSSNVDYIKLILQTGPDLEVKTISGRTPLHWATYNGNIGLIQILLEAGANKNAKNNAGYTPWNLARSLTREAVPQLNPNFNE